jgi:hypothetical protein
MSFHFARDFQLEWLCGTFIKVEWILLTVLATRCGTQTISQV